MHCFGERGAVWSAPPRENAKKTAIYVELAKHSQTAESRNYHAKYFGINGKGYHNKNIYLLFYQAVPHSGDWVPLVQIQCWWTSFIQYWKAS